MKHWIESSRLLLGIKYPLLRHLHYLDYLRRKDPHEIEMATTKGNPFANCPDWQEIKKVPEAGRIVRGHLHMHNGIKVLPTAYNGYAHYRVMARGLGVHEPQEERLFRDVLPHVVPGSWS